MPVHDADFEVRAGEILGFAGVDGNGQTELAEAIAGVRRISSGSIELEGQSIGGTSIHGRRRVGLSYLPADRNRDGLIPAFSIEQNLLLGNETERRWGGGYLLRPKRTREAADTLIRECGVRGADNGGRTIVSNLSGGNQQKVLVGRALADRPKVLIACQPTRGLDILAAQSVYDRLRREAAEGLAVLLFSLDLDELLDLSDRVIVMFDGRLSAPIAKVDATRDIVGRLMTGLAQAEATTKAEATH
jgi:simple sugar transport system ATP-binding protein